MAGVSVEKGAVDGAIRLCQKTIQEFEKTNNDLKRRYQAAGTGWKDSKYKQLGDLVNECTTALTKPQKELQDCIAKLQELLKAIEAYEATKVK